MIRYVSAAAVLAIMVSASSVQAAEKTVILKVEKATCALCAPIVKRTIAKVTGVKIVSVAEANADSPAVATVTFDDAVTSVPTLIAATTNAGYPSHPAN
jgi:mercuric ion binding protein